MALNKTQAEAVRKFVVEHGTNVPGRGYSITDAKWVEMLRKCEVQPVDLMASNGVIYLDSLSSKPGRDVKHIVSVNALDRIINEK